jgi:hypothetical protein
MRMEHKPPSGNHFQFWRHGKQFTIHVHFAVGASRRTVHQRIFYTIKITHLDLWNQATGNDFRFVSQMTDIQN